MPDDVARYERLARATVLGARLFRASAGKRAQAVWLGVKDDNPLCADCGAAPARAFLQRRPGTPADGPDGRPACVRCVDAQKDAQENAAALDVIQDRCLKALGFRACIDCGLRPGADAPFAYFQYDHADTFVKSGGIRFILGAMAADATVCSRADLLSELAKCTLKCKPCHAVHSATRIAVMRFAVYTQARKCIKRFNGIGGAPVRQPPPGPPQFCDLHDPDEDDAPDEESTGSTDKFQVYRLLSAAPVIAAVQTGRMPDTLPPDVWVDRCERCLRRDVYGLLIAASPDELTRLKAKAEALCPPKDTTRSAEAQARTAKRRADGAAKGALTRATKRPNKTV